MFNVTKGINLARQAGYIKKKYPSFRVDMPKSASLVVHGALRPTARSCDYSFRMTYHIGSRPRVYIIDPPLSKNENNERPPHLYGDWSLCLYLPGTGQFSDKQWIGDTIIPWISLWLFYYENWLVNGYHWNGGGVHPGEDK